MPDLMTKAGFLAAYRAALLEAYPWAKDAERLEKFMDAARADLAGAAACVDWTGAAVLQVWRAIGGKGRPTRKALRALPDGVDA